MYVYICILKWIAQWIRPLWFSTGDRGSDPGQGVAVLRQHPALSCMWISSLDDAGSTRSASGVGEPGQPGENWAAGRAWDLWLLRKLPKSRLTEKQLLAQWKESYCN